MKKILRVAIIIGGILFCIPLMILVIFSFMDQQELNSYVIGIFGTKQEYAKFSLIPKYPTLENYLRLLLDTPQFLATFWNSAKITVAVVLGQVLVAVPAAWGLAKHRIPYKKSIWTFYIAMMLMPFQIKMLSEYLILGKIGLLNTLWAIILPGIFSAFPVFIIYHYFKAIPDEILDNAKIDGANRWQIFIRIAVPIGKNGIAAAMILSFFEYWNLIEQPLIFLKKKALWPLSLFSPDIVGNDSGIALATAVFSLIPTILVFWIGQDILEDGAAALLK